MKLTQGGWGVRPLFKHLKGRLDHPVSDEKCLFIMKNEHIADTLFAPVFMVFDSSRLVFHGSRSIFMVFNGSRLVFIVPGQF